jgi:hypothetical protein
MHQLTKDPPMLAEPGDPTDPTPYGPIDLPRYLDFCSEMLALISKVAVLYAQDSTDVQTIGVIDEIEDLTNGLSRKIWQKIMLIQRVSDELSPRP